MRHINSIENVLKNRILIHLTDEELTEYHDDIVRDELKHACMETHLRRCLICRRRLEFLQEVTKEAAATQPSEVPPIYYETAQRLLHSLVGGTAKEKTSIAGRESEHIGAQFWLGENSYPLRPSEMDPTLLEVGGNLVLADLLVAPDSDTVRIERAGRTIVIPLSSFKGRKEKGVRMDRNDHRNRPSLKLTASRPSHDKKSHSLKHEGPVLVRQCDIEDLTVEILSNEAGCPVFLRLSEKE